MAQVNGFYAVYLPAILLIIGAVFYVIGRQFRIPPRQLSASVRPKLSVAFRVLYPSGWRRPHEGRCKVGSGLEITGLLLTAAAFLSAIGYWYWWLYLRH